MRITPNITMQNSLYNIQRVRNQLDSTNEKIASGQNYNRPSDDPVAARLLIGLNDRLRANEQYASNIDKASIALKMTDAPLTAMITTLSNVRSLASTATSGSLDDITRQNTISQLTAFREQLADYGNTQIGNQYIFAGTMTTTKPFDRAVQSPPDTAPYYNGNDETISVEIDAGVTETTNIPGSQVLTGPDVNILKTLDELIDKLENDPADILGMQALATQLDDGAQQIYNAQVTNGTRITRIEALDRMLYNSNNTIQTVLGDVQNADYAKLAVELQQQQMAFEATLSTTAKVSQMSLLDYL